ncbi:hypothetical protein ACFE04_012911 [Oxalis oulophora]
MGKRGGVKKTTGTPHGCHTPMTLRDKASGNKINVDVKSKLKHQHLHKLALWASTGEDSNPSLAAFFGHWLAAVGEVSGIQPDPSVFSCQRCETLLQPGINCTIRIEKNQKKWQRNKKSSIFTQNNVVHTCHYCSHKNLKRGTPKGHMKEICPPKVKPSPKSIPSTPMLKKCGLQDTRTKEGIFKVDNITSPAMSLEFPTGEYLGTPLPKEGTKTTLLDAKSKKRDRSVLKKKDRPQSLTTPINVANGISASSKKKKRKSWTGLKEIAESREKDRNRNIADIKLPFFL